MESLGKGNGKKWSQIKKTFTTRGCKIAAQKKVCFWANFALLSRIFLVLVLLSELVERCSVPHRWNFLLTIVFVERFSVLYTVNTFYITQKAV